MTVQRSLSSFIYSRITLFSSQCLSYSRVFFCEYHLCYVENNNQENSTTLIRGKKSNNQYNEKLLRQNDLKISSFFRFKGIYQNTILRPCPFLINYTLKISRHKIRMTHNFIYLFFVYLSQSLALAIIVKH